MEGAASSTGSEQEERLAASSSSSSSSSSIRVEDELLSDVVLHSTEVEEVPQYHLNPPLRQTVRAPAGAGTPPKPRRVNDNANNQKMKEFLHQVRRKSGLSPTDDSEDDDDCTTTIDGEGESAPRASATATATATSNLPLRTSNSNGNGNNNNVKLSIEDIEICQRLDDEYERALEEREIGYNARYGSVRQSAFLSVFFMCAYLFLGTAFFMRQAAWTIPDSLLFSIYTITTVGYGKSELPTTPGFQAYTIFYILVGIAALTIMVAQVYQCIALEASRAQHSRDKTEMRRRGLDILETLNQQQQQGGPSVHGEPGADEIIAYHHENLPSIIDWFFRCYDRAKHFFRTNEIGRGFSVIFPFAGLILIGALVVGPIEGWTFLEALYFSVVSLTTVGFGDYIPTKLASIWFCIFWLPFSVGFMSMFLGNIAAFYIRLSDRNIRRIDKQMRRRLQRAKDKAELERAEVLQRAYRGQEVEIEATNASIHSDGDGDSDAAPKEKEQKKLPTSNSRSNSKIPPHHAQSLARRKEQQRGGFNALPTNDGNDSDQESSETHILFGSSPSDSGTTRRQRILENSNVTSEDKTKRPNGRTMQSMKDIVLAVRKNLEASQKDSGDATIIRSGPDVQFMSIRSTQTITHHSMIRRVQTRKPSFALRVLLQERFAEIIATDIAGFQSSIEIKETTLSVTIDSLKETADKWLIPRRARKAFRAVAFEVLYFVGEHGLITRGADALYDMSPFEFHGLFSPLVAAMGDAETMEGWLASTDILADVDLRLDGSRPGMPLFEDVAENGKLTPDQQQRLKQASNRHQRLSPGNAFQFGGSD